MKTTLFVVTVMVAFYSAQASATCPLSKEHGAKGKAATESCMKDALALNKGVAPSTKKSQAVR